jgi:hypothetical protein
VNLYGSKVGEYYVLNVNGKFSTVSEVIILVPGAVEVTSFSDYCHSVYLVNSGDELLLVVRLLDHQFPREGNASIRTVYFDVYRFSLIRLRTGHWDKVKDLGDRLLFVGENSCVSLSLSAADVRGCLENPRYDGCLKNCIYFMDDSRVRCHVRCHDIGVRVRGCSLQDHRDGGCLENCNYFMDDSGVRHYGVDGSKRPPPYDTDDDDGAFDWDSDRGIFKLTEGIIHLPCRTRDPHALWITPTP